MSRRRPASNRGFSRSARRVSPVNRFVPVRGGIRL